jgi:hypothetical protein
LLLDLAGRTDLQAVADGRPDQLAVVSASAGSWVGTDALLVRPDGYVAWSARDRDDDPITLDRAITRWFGPAAY